MMTVQNNNVFDKLASGWDIAENRPQSIAQLQKLAANAKIVAIATFIFSVALCIVPTTPITFVVTAILFLTSCDADRVSRNIEKVLGDPAIKTESSKTEAAWKRQISRKTFILRALLNMNSPEEEPKKAGFFKRKA